MLKQVYSMFNFQNVFDLQILVGSAYPVQWGQSNEIAVAKIIAAGTETAMRILKTTKEKEAISSSTQLGGSKRPCTSTPKTRTSSSQPSSPKKPRSSTPKAQTQSTKQNNKVNKYNGAFPLL